MKRTAQLVVAITVGACAGSQPAPTPVSRPQPASPAAPSNDDETVLSARPWKYGSYFNRLKRTVATAWKPLDVWKALPEAQRASLGTGLRETVVHVELSMDGEITKLEIRTSSGVPELDAEATRAFQVSSPFGATPDGLQLKPFSFGFIFEIGSGTSSTTVAP